MQNQKSALGMEGNITALIGYIISIVALVLIFIEKDNKFVRFHAIQSVIWWVAMWVVFFVLWVVVIVIGVVLAMISSSLATIVWILSTLIFLGWFVALVGGVIFAAIKAYGGNMFKLPIVGGLAEKWA